MTASRDGLVPGVDLDRLLAGAKEAGLHAQVAGRTVCQVPGADLQFDDLFTLVDSITDALEHAYSGVVVVQGTDTIEETAFALDLLLRRDEPIVVTGAMRGASQPGADGPANILDAVALAASPDASGLGVVVTISGEIHAASLVRKSHPFLPHAFKSVTGPLGWIAEGRPLILTRPARARAALPVPIDRSALRPVALVPVSLADNGALLRAVIELPYAGVVVDAMGAGHVPHDLVAPLEDLAGRMPVVLCSRTRGGGALLHTYGFPGSERDLLARGLLSGGFLDGTKARIALMLLLAAGCSQAQLAAFFSALA